MKKNLALHSVKTKKWQVALSVAMSLAFSNGLYAQTSYDANSVPISGGPYNCAFGYQALNHLTGSADGNVAVGVQTLTLTTTGAGNTAVGSNSMFLNQTGSDNVAIGWGTLHDNKTGIQNVAVGSFALTSNLGTNNVGTGYNALQSNTTGGNNTAIGWSALYSNTTSSYNTAVGSNSLYFNTTGVENTASGYSALLSNTSGRDNVASGFYAMNVNTTGSYNTATGTYALRNNVSNFYNAAFGYETLQGNTADNNAAFGFRAMKCNMTGTNNAACGFAALYTNSSGNNNTSVGYQTLWTNTTGSNNTAIGFSADASSSALSNATVIGAGAIVNASNKVRIGSTTVTVVEGPVSYTFSDGRFKTDVKADDVKGLTFINKLRPVVYNLDTRKVTEFWTKNMPDSTRNKYMSQDFDASTKVRQSGFIAQEVATAAKEANYDFNGVHTPDNADDNYSIAYAEFVVPLVKGMQEQQKMIEDQKQMIDDQKQMIENLQQQINDIKQGQGSTTGIGQVSMSGASMDQNVPNPFSNETVIKFNLPQTVGNAYMAVYDLSGKQLKTLPISQRGASSLTITSDLMAAGIYVYSIVADGKLVSSKRMVVADK